MPKNESENVTWKTHNNKVMKIIIDLVKDHILPSKIILKLHLKCSPPFKIHLKLTIQVDY